MSRNSGMDFARKILNKFGWKEGDGLGKNSNGISKPLKANLKFDTAGFGADQAGDFNNNWWERVYNEAADNVTVKAKSGGVQLALKNTDETVEITTKGYSVKKLKKLKEKNIENGKYEGFLQTTILTQTGGELGSVDCKITEDIEVKKFEPLTDAELLKACGGRTAHKGARHGLKLCGKLARLEKQEQEMLAKMLERKDNAGKFSNQSQDTGIVDSAKEGNNNRRKSKRKEHDESNEAVKDLSVDISQASERIDQFNTKSSDRTNYIEQGLAGKVDNIDGKCKKKSRKNEDSQETQADSTERMRLSKRKTPLENTSHFSKPSKKKKKTKNKKP